MRSSTIKPRVIAVRVEVQALDEFEHEIRLAGVRDAGIDQAGNVRMRQPREDRALAAESLFAAAADERRVQQLDRHLSFVAAITA